MEFKVPMGGEGLPARPREVEDVTILGSGPAGLTAALYAARAQLKPLVVAGDTLGGQVSLTYEIENYPGFPEPLGGQELVERFQQQAERFGARILFDTAVEVDLSERPFRIKTYGEEFRTKALIIATGASARKLNVPGEKEFTGRGVSYCATCDGFFFKDQRVVVVGGGDSALEEALFLTRFAREVYIVHRRDQLRAGKILQQRAFANEKIQFIWNTVVEEILGDEKVRAVRLKDVKTGEVQEFPTDGVFIFIGHDPNSALFRGQLEMDERGYLIVDRRMHTSVPGVFAAGEIADPVFRQVVISAGMGAMAAMEAEKYLAEQAAEEAGIR